MPTDNKLRDRRASGRIQVGFPVEMTDISFAYQGTATDLSPGGLRARMQKALPPVGTDLDLLLRPPGEAPLRLKGRVMHFQRSEVGVAFAVGDPQVFEAALNLFETLVMCDSKLAITLKKRPVTLEYTQRLYPMPLRDQVLSGPEHWVYGLLSTEGTLLGDLRQSLSADWAHLAHVPFMLLERGIASLQPQSGIDETPVKMRAPVVAAAARRPGGPTKR